MTEAIAPTGSPDVPAPPALDTSAVEHIARTPPTSKSDSVIKLLRRAKGGTIAEVQEVTAWQPHSVRAFLSGLRKKGLVLSKEVRRSGETSYRLAAKSAPAVTTDA